MYLIRLGWPEVVYDAAEEVEEGGGDGGVGPHRVVHHQNGRLNVHDIVLHITTGQSERCCSSLFLSPWCRRETVTHRTGKIQTPLLKGIGCS